VQKWLLNIEIIHDGKYNLLKLFYKAN